MKTVKRTGLGKSAFFGLRYFDDGSENPDFVLNKAEYREASILVTGANFGCGSSREHAPWALLDTGIWCIISTSFADIFYNNCFKNGMLPIALSAEQVAMCLEDAKAGLELTVDLPAQTITRANGEAIAFEVPLLSSLSTYIISSPLLSLCVCPCLYLYLIIFSLLFPLR